MKWIQKSILIVTGVSAILLAILKLIGELSHIPWLKQELNSVILICLGLILLSIIYERHFILEKIIKDFNDHLATTKDDFAYLRNASETKSELIEAVSSAKLYIYSIGSKTQAEDYLRFIQDKTKKTNIQYNRLITGDHITHQLHAHLNSLIENDNVKIKWIESEKYGNITMTENNIVIALPSPEQRKFSGIGISNVQDVKFYSLYFNKAFDNNSNYVLTKKSELELFCEKCSPSTAKKSNLIREKLEQL